MDLFWEKLGRLVKPEAADMPMATGPWPFQATPLTVRDVRTLIENKAHFLISPKVSGSLDVTNSPYMTVALAAREDGNDDIEARLLAALWQQWEAAMGAAGVTMFTAIEWRQPPRLYQEKDMETSEVTHSVVMRLSVFAGWPKLERKLA